MKRIFLVGAPRSGTTILQSLLAAHPKITSFPETKFFHHLWTDRLASKLPDRLYDFFHKEINRPDLYDPVEVYERQSSTDRINWFIKMLDLLAIEQGNQIWLEKTPEHVYFVESILDYLPDAKFIHIIRHPLDVVASMRKATEDDATNHLWGGRWNLEFCVSRWNSSVMASYSYARKTHGHLVVKYEDLLKDKIRFLSECCYFLDIAYDVEMIRNYRDEALRLGQGFAWHNGNDRAIESALAPKYRQHLSEKEIEYVLRNTVQSRERFGYDGLH